MLSNRVRTMLAMTLLLSFAITISWAKRQSDSADDSGAIKQAVAAFTDAFNRHNAHACAMQYVEDADFSGVRGNVIHGRNELEEHYATIFGGSLKSVRSTFTVRRIRFLTPEIAAVDIAWTAAGSKAPDGSDKPLRNGLIDLVMTKRSGPWLITIYHESEITLFPSK